VYSLTTRVGRIFGIDLYCLWLETDKNKRTVIFDLLDHPGQNFTDLTGVGVITLEDDRFWKTGNQFLIINDNLERREKINNAMQMGFINPWGISNKEMSQ
jgi:hypothetical protein